MKPYSKAISAVLLGCLAVIVVAVTIKVVISIYKKNQISSKGYVAVVELNGMILDSAGFLREMKKYEDDDKLKAMVVRINSPGGVVAPSEEMYRAIRKMDKKIPVVASMGALAASGGYYAAMGARKIFANHGTLTASIGVIMEFVNTERLYQWAKIKRFTMKAGKFKDIGSPQRQMKPEERRLLEAMLVSIHTQFRSLVQERRKLTDAELNVAADGRIMTGGQAKQMKLVDEIGGFEEAIADAKKIAGLDEEAYVHHPEAEKTLLEKLFLSKTSIGRFLESVTQYLNHQSRSFDTAGWQILLLPSSF